MGNPNSESLGLITTSMYIAGFVSAIPSQQVMDRYGRRMSIIIGMALRESRGSVACVRKCNTSSDAREQSSSARPSRPEP